MLNKIIFVFICSLVLSPNYGMEHYQKSLMEQDQDGQGEFEFPNCIDATRLKTILGYKDGKSEEFHEVDHVQIGKYSCKFKGLASDYYTIIDHLASGEQCSAACSGENYGGGATTKGFETKEFEFDGGIYDFTLFLGENPVLKPKKYELLWTTTNAIKAKAPNSSQLAIYLVTTFTDGIPNYQVMCTAQGKTTKEIESYNPEQSGPFAKTKLSIKFYNQVLERLKPNIRTSGSPKGDANCETAEDANTICCKALMDWACYNEMVDHTFFSFQLSIAQKKEVRNRAISSENSRNVGFLIRAITNKNLPKDALKVVIYAYPAIIDPSNLFDKLLAEVRDNTDCVAPVREFLINLNFVFTQFSNGSNNLLPFRAQLEELDALVRLPSMFFESSNFPSDSQAKPILSPRQNPNNPFYLDFQTGIVAKEFSDAKDLLNAADFFQRINAEDLAWAIKVRAIELFKNVTPSDIVASSKALADGGCEYVRYTDGVSNMAKYIIWACQADEAKKATVTNTFFKMGRQYWQDGYFQLAFQLYVAIASLDAQKYIEPSNWKLFSDPVTERVALVFRDQDERPYLPRLNHITMMHMKSEEGLSGISNDEDFLTKFKPLADLYKAYLSLKIFAQPTPSYTNREASEFVRTLSYFTQAVYDDLMKLELNKDIIVRTTSSGRDRTTSVGRDSDKKENDSTVRKSSKTRSKEHSKKSKKESGVKFHKESVKKT